MLDAQSATCVFDWLQPYDIQLARSEQLDDLVSLVRASKKVSDITDSVMIDSKSLAVSHEKKDI